jgi:hypothetical protein
MVGLIKGKYVRAAQEFHVEGFNLKKLIVVEGRKQYQLQISNRSTDFDN